MRKKGKRAKAIKLDKSVWLRNSNDIKTYRQSELVEQEFKCAITGLPLTNDNSVLDHTHANGIGVDGKVRGVLLSEVNCLEGKYLKSFQKLKLDTKYGIDFPQFLINMGHYLLQDNSNKPYHFKYMADLRDHLKYLRKDTLSKKLKNDFGITVEAAMDKRELIRLYTQSFVNLVEEKEKS